MVAAKAVVHTEHGNLTNCRRSHGPTTPASKGKKRARRDDDDDDDAPSRRQLLELMQGISAKLDALDAKVDDVAAKVVPRRSGRS